MVFLSLVLSVINARADYTDKLLTIPEDEIDVGVVGLQLDKTFYPTLDVPACSRRIDDLSRLVLLEARGSSDPFQRIRALNEVLFRRIGFRYDGEALAVMLGDKPEVSHLSRLLETREGDCFSLHLLYLAVAQGAGYPVYPVHAPSHYFVRYVVSPSEHINVETTDDGKIMSDGDYVRKFSLSEKSLKSGAYLRTLSRREYVSLLLQNRSALLSEAGRFDEAMLDAEKSVRFDPRCVSCYRQLVHLHDMKCALSSGEESLHHDDESRRFIEKSDALGWIYLQDTQLWKEKVGK